MTPPPCDRDPTWLGDAREPTNCVVWEVGVTDQVVVVVAVLDRLWLDDCSNSLQL